MPAGAGGAAPATQPSIPHRAPVSPPPPLTTTLAAPGVDLELTLPTLRMGVGDPCWAVDGRGAWTWATRTPEGPATLRLAPVDDTIRAEAWGPGAAWAERAAPGLAGTLDRPGAPPGAPAEVVELVERFGGLRLARSARPFDAAVAAVCRRGVSAYEAGRSWALMIESWGDDAPGPGGLRLPPSPGRLAAASPYEMHVLGLEQERAAEVQRLASHATRLEVGADEEPEAVVGRIRDVSGVGADVVAHVRATALGDPDAVPVVDGHLLAALRRALGATDATPPEELLAPYRPQRGRLVRLVEAAVARATP